MSTENFNKNDLGKVRLVPLTDEWFEAAKVTINARLHLERSLKSLVNEQAPTPSFPLYGSRDAISIIRRFLDSVPWSKYSLPPGWKDYEYDRLKKVGPQGGHPSWEEVESLFMLYQERLSPVDTVAERSMTEIAEAIYRVFTNPVQPYAVDITLAQLLAKDKIFTTAAGCRSFDLKKSDPKAQAIALHDIKTGLLRRFRMYVFERYNKLKPRIFMPGPFSNMIEQAAFQVPMMDVIQNGLRFQKCNFPLYNFADKIGFDPMFHDIFAGKMELALKKLQRRLRRLGIRFELSKIRHLYIQGDFEKMDTTTGPAQYDQLYLPLAELCIAPEHRKKFREVMMQTVSMPIISPSGVMVGPHGTGSGMENTNNGESWCNLYYATETVNKFHDIMKQKLPHVIYEVVGFYVNGDDSTFNIIFYDISDAELAKAKKYFQDAAEQTAKHCGFRINDKWRMDEFFGLYNQNGYWFTIDSNLRAECHYIYPSTLILNSIMNPEHQYTKAAWDKDYRDLDVTEKLDNGRYLPYFHLLVDFVDNGMKYHLLGRTENETRRILSKWDKYRAQQSLGERYNRQDYNISTSATLNYILTKRARAN